MLPLDQIFAVPDLCHAGPAFQIINVPMPLSGVSQMPRYAGPYTSRPERTANIDIEPLLELHISQTPYRNRSRMVALPHECICSGKTF